VLGIVHLGCILTRVSGGKPHGKVNLLKVGTVNARGRAGRLATGVPGPIARAAHRAPMTVALLFQN